VDRFIVSAPALLVTLVAGGYLSAAQAPSGDAPNYQISQPNYQYATTVSSLHDLDFNNFKKLTVFRPKDNKPDESVDLVNGKFSRKYPEGGGKEVDLVQLRITNGGRRAVIDVLWRNCGASCADAGLVQVFELQADHPTVVEQITYDPDGPNTGIKLDAQSRVLTVTGRSAESAPHCCAKSLDVMNFEWDGGKFIFKDSERVALPDSP
jgi:hypothetical protein